MKHLILKLFIFIFLTVPLISHAQRAKIQGMILDEDSQALAGANVYLSGTVLGASSDENGKFLIVNVPLGEFTLVISVIGYQKKEIQVSISQAEKVYNVREIKLTSVALKSEPIIVTASKYEQNIQDVPSSISILSSSELMARNSVTVDEALQYISGIHLNASQISIRNSTGYSKGVGSRVMMLVDGLPYLTGDTQEINFESLQINEIERVEIVKGAGSALYGSSAIGGVINVITKDIEEQRKIGLKMYGGFYSKPYYPEWEWSDATRFLSGLSFNFSERKEKIGYRVSAAHDQDDSFKKNDWLKRYHVGGKIEFEISPFKKLKLATNYMLQKRGNFLYWKDLSNALIPPDDQLDDQVEAKRSYINASYRHVLDDDRFYSIKAIWFHNQFDDNIEDQPGSGGNHSKSDFIDGEFQYNIGLEKHFFTAGISFSYNRVSSNLFGNQSGRNLALYGQDEIKLSDNMLTSLGIRLDYFDIDSLKSDYQINPKLGLIYKIWQGGALRGSVGHGFRAPSVAESFTSTTAGGLRVIPNLDLKPERSISYELGINQVISDRFFIDFAAFYNRFWNLIEGKFIASGDIQFRNVTDAKITGFELNFIWSIIANLLDYRVGYTFTEPLNMSKDEYLTYRPRHLFYSNVVLQYKYFKAGVDYRFISRYDKIDEDFARIIPNAEERVPVHVLDCRISAELYMFLISFQINNILQYHYVDLIGSIAKTRNYILTVTTTF